MAAASAALLATAKVLSRDSEATVAAIMRENRLLQRYGSMWLAAVRRTSPGRRAALATAHWVRARTHIYMIGLRRADAVTALQLRRATAVISAKARVAIARARLHPVEADDVTALRWRQAWSIRRWRLTAFMRRGLFAAPRASVCDDGRLLATACLLAVGEAGRPLTAASAWTVTARLGSVAVPAVDTHRLLAVHGRWQLTKVVVAYRQPGLRERLQLAGAEVSRRGECGTSGRPGAGQQQVRQMRSWMDVQDGRGAKCQIPT